MPVSVETKLSKLSTGLKNTQASPHTSGVSLPTQPSATPDSWEDEDNETSDTAVEAPGPSLKQMTSNEGPAPPPPTPISPQNGEGYMSRKWEPSVSSDSGRPTPRYSQPDQASAEKRPEKTTATANRLIAGALGIKAPKKTEEQKQYEKATKEAEIRRKAREKEAKERERQADEQAKTDVWNS